MNHPIEHAYKDSLGDLLHLIIMGEEEEDIIMNAGNGLERLEKEMTAPEKEKFKEISGGKTINQVIQECFDAFNADIIEQDAIALTEEETFSMHEENGQYFIIEPSLIFGPDNVTHGAPHITYLSESQANYYKRYAKDEARSLRIKGLSAMLSVPLTDYITMLWQRHMTGDAGPDGTDKEKAEALVNEFTEYINTRKEEIAALTIYCNRLHKGHGVAMAVIYKLIEKLQQEKPVLTPLRVWLAYSKMDNVKQSGGTVYKTAALVALLRRVNGTDPVLTPFEQTVDKNFEKWLAAKRAASHVFNEEQIKWLCMMKDFFADNLRIQKEDIDMHHPFDENGGLRKFYKLFGNNAKLVLDELNEQLAA